MQFATPQSILLIGGTGTFGHAFLTRTLSKWPDASVSIFSRDEFKQHRMRVQFSDYQDRVSFVLGDIRDQYRIERAMWNIDLVVHAAALKQVSILESNPLEAVKTNVIGTQNVIEAALSADVPTNVLISSDKAVHPHNTYGASKMMAEAIWRGANDYAGGRSDSRFLVARYGNVLGSRGSVLPIWREQLRATGRIIITDPSSTRFILTPSDAVGVVHRLIEIGQDAQVAIPLLGACTITELATAVVGDNVDWDIVGLRQGEKVHEELATVSELNTSELVHCGNLDAMSQFYMIGARERHDTYDEPFTSDRASMNSRLSTSELRDLVDKAEVSGLLRL